VASDLGFNCDHLRIGFAKEDPEHKPYCKGCWTRLKTVKPPVVNGRKVVKRGEYWPLETFLDVFSKDRAKKRVTPEYLIFKNEN
jgi:hypothetical protein